jgi:hypothetical protein
MTRRTTQQINQSLETFWPDIETKMPGAKREFILSLAEKIANFDSVFVDPPQELTPALKELAKQAKKMLDRTLDFDHHFPEVGKFVRAASFAADTWAFHDRVGDIKLMKGGKTQERIDKARRQLTARFAHRYFQRFPDVPPPTGTRGGRYIWFSEALFEMATGKETNLYKECCEVLELEKQKRRRLELRQSRRLDDEAQRRRREAQRRRRLELWNRRQD